jgi:tetratricopeptide (TPR) repeat protein
VASLLLASLVALNLPPELSGQSGGPSPEPATALGYYSRGEERRFAEDSYGAIDDYMAALRLNANYGEAFVGLAECYYDLEEYDQALSYATRAATYRRDDNSLTDLEAFIRLGLGDTTAARTRFNSVLAVLPNDLDARFGLALLDLAAGKKTEAKGRLEESLRIAPQNARALVSLALIALDQARPADAALLVKKALEAHPGDARVQFVAARVADARGDRETAIFHARNAVSLQPGRAEARRLLGSLLYEARDYEGVSSIMRESTARDRKDQGAWFTLGLAQIALGKTA